jgi:hypothetical protein
VLRAGIDRRAVMRVDADARKRELGQVGVPDQTLHRLRAAGPRLGSRVLPALRRPSTRTRRAGLTGDVEQVLDRHRQPGQRGQRRTVRVHRVDGLAAARAWASKRRMKARAQVGLSAGF